MPHETHYCAHCVHYRYVADADAGEMMAGCVMRQAIVDGPHHCPFFVREPGADDDLEWLP